MIQRSTAKVRFYRDGGALMFHLERSSIADVGAVPFVFDGPATMAHMQEYAREYKAFLETEAKIEKEVEAVLEIGG